jgi:hypothetical protein
MRKQAMLGAGRQRHPYSKRGLQEWLPRTHNRLVVGSTPTGPTKFLRTTAAGLTPKLLSIRLMPFD